MTDKSCEGSKTLSYLQTNKSACDSVMDAGRRYKTTGSETKNSSLHTTTAIARVSFLCWFPPGGMERAKWYLYPLWIASQKRNRDLITGSKHAFSSLGWETSALPSNAILGANIFQITVLEQRQAVPLLALPGRTSSIHFRGCSLGLSCIPGPMGNMATATLTSMRIIFGALATQTVIHESAVAVAFGSLLDVWILRPHPRPSDSISIVTRSPGDSYAL